MINNPDAINTLSDEAKAEMIANLDSAADMTFNQLSITQVVLKGSAVAKLLCVSEDTVQNLHRTYQLRGHLIGRHLRWRTEDVIAFVKNLPVKDDGPA